MALLKELKNINICVKSRKLVRQILEENPKVEKILRVAKTEGMAIQGIHNMAMENLSHNPEALAYYKREKKGRKEFEALKWQEYAAIRLLDYADHAGREIPDPNLKGKLIVNDPIVILWYAVTTGRGGGTVPFFEDMLHLFRQFSGKEKRDLPTKKTVEEWMAKYATGLDPRIIKMREENKDRILKIIIEKIDRGDITSKKYFFKSGMTPAEKLEEAYKWWKESSFHLKFAVRSPYALNEMLEFTLNETQMQILKDAEKVGIPFFVNPYYLSLINNNVHDFLDIDAIHGDFAIRVYVLYSRDLVNDFGKIHSWEREDIIQPGKPNAAGWLVPPGHSIHRRYPNVAIFVPQTVGRACGGLCASCQRMYGFQSGQFNFDLDELKPKRSWKDTQAGLLDYFGTDSQLQDILITGGDALMSRDKTLKGLLDDVYNMAVKKRKDNESRKDGEKYAELVRVRLGTRLPIYLPWRITPKLCKILADFKARASRIGIKQFFIQTHFESPMEITPESRDAVKALNKAGWMVTNQLVFTSAAARRGHNAKLRQTLNDIGVLTYYTFTCKGYQENKFNFATNARSVQEQIEEKVIGKVPESDYDLIRDFPLNAENMVGNIDKLRKSADLPFLSTDRSVLNLPGVGKSLAFRQIGLTYDGRRVLLFDHDTTRPHSPVIKKIGKVTIIESKSINELLTQLDEMGEDTAEYESIWGYSVCEMEPREPVYEHPGYDFKTTDQYTNLDVEDWKEE